MAVVKKLGRAGAEVAEGWGWKKGRAEVEVAVEEGRTTAGTARFELEVIVAAE